MTFLDDESPRSLPILVPPRLVIQRTCMAQFLCTHRSAPHNTAPAQVGCGPMLEQTPERPRATSEDEAGGRSPIPWSPAADAQGPQLRASSGNIRLYLFTVFFHHSCLGVDKNLMPFSVRLVSVVSKSLHSFGGCKPQTSLKQVCPPSKPSYQLHGHLLFPRLASPNERLTWDKC